MVTMYLRGVSNEMKKIESVLIYLREHNDVCVKTICERRFMHEKGERRFMYEKGVKGLCIRS